MTMFDFVWLCMPIYDYYDKDDYDDYVSLCIPLYSYSFLLSLTLFDHVLSCMTLCYSGCLFLILYNTLLHCKSQLDTVWICMTLTLNDSVRISSNYIEYFWLCGSIWLYLTLIDSLWLYLILFLSVWLCHAWLHLDCLCLTF